jgi:hypothetical protein
MAPGERKGDGDAEEFPAALTPTQVSSLTQFFKALDQLNAAIRHTGARGIQVNQRCALANLVNRLIIEVSAPYVQMFQAFDIAKVSQAFCTDLSAANAQI